MPKSGILKNSIRLVYKEINYVIVYYSFNQQPFTLYGFRHLYRS